MSLQRLLLPTPAILHRGLFQPLIFALVRGKSYCHPEASRGWAGVLPGSTLCAFLTDIDTTKMFFLG